MDITTAEHAVRAHFEKLLSPLELQPSSLQYSLERKGALRWPFLVTAHLRVDDELRMSIMKAIGVHMLGVKLVDDLLDGDTSHPPADLSAGVFLVQCAAADLCQFENRREIRDTLQKRYSVIMLEQIRELRTRPCDFPSWASMVEYKAGYLLATYAEIASLASSPSPSSSETEKVFAFFSALGRILMLRDDLIDFDRGQIRGGNIRHLVNEGSVKREEVLAFLEHSTSESRSIGKELGLPTHLVSTIVNYSDETRRMVSSTLG